MEKQICYSCQKKNKPEFLHVCYTKHYDKKVGKNVWGKLPSKFYRCRACLIDDLETAEDYRTVKIVSLSQSRRTLIAPLADEEPDDEELRREQEHNYRRDVGL